MKRIKIIHTIVLLFPLTLMAQSDTIIVEIPDFISYNYFHKKDSILRSCFCFDNSDKQIIKVKEKVKDIKNCKILEHKSLEGKSYWSYDLYIKNVDYQISLEYININSSNWLMKKYNNNSLISEHNVKVTNEQIAIDSTYSRKFYNEDFILKVYKVMKTKID
ncbi:hypothetical protein [Thalassobellus sediminis]|uniref:hypothetical protein n=1 Tax=Thalassobellus sediminis TaxID=3367753 RepID=UPI0037BAD5E1